MRPTHRFLDIPDYQQVSDEIYEYVVDRTDLLNENKKEFFSYMDVDEMLKHTPLLQKFLQEKSLHPTVIGIVVVHVNSPPNLHVDSPPNLHVDFVDTLHTTYVRMLWPVKHCYGSRTIFYDVPKEFLTITQQQNGIPYYDIPTDRDWEYLNEFELTSPVVFDSMMPHEVVLAPNATDHRISCTIGFSKELLLSKSLDAWDKF
jgi:hypothetical protein